MLLSKCIRLILFNMLSSVFLVILLIIIIYLCNNNYFYEFNPAPKEYIIKVFNSTDLYDDYDSVVSLLSNASTNKIKIEFIAWDSNFIVLRSPAKFNAKNWVLYLEFKNNRVVGKYIRYHDSRHAKPLNAPMDSVSLNVHVEFIQEYTN